ncbi:MAG: Rpn family recombination-promoting nuclease/putative transposase [Crocosphaera sp.]|nr:Rpn family recombination-promoting nuclease/putative transposase [Crocosphaera sp.]
MYDNICKFLVESFPEDFATWLLGEPIPLTTLSPSELSLEPIRADALILLSSPEVVLHLEFQTKPDETIPFRILDYRVRVYRRFPDKQMRQVVIYLKPSTSELVQQKVFAIPNTRHQFEVIRLWEIPTEQLLNSSGLWPLAVLSQTDHPVNTLQEIGQKIDSLDNLRQQSNIAASTAILAGLLLEEAVIQTILRSEIMRESVIYQRIESEGILKGKQEEGTSLILRLLKHRFTTIPAEIEAKIHDLPIEKLEELGEALLDFQSEQDLINWFEN